MTDLAQKIADAVREYINGRTEHRSVEDAIRSALPVAQGEAVGFGEGTKNGLLLEPDDLRGMMEWAGIGDGYDEGDAAALLLWIGEMADDDGSVTYGLNARNEEVPEEGSWFIRALPRPAPPASRIAELEREVEMLREALTVMLEIHGVTQRYADTHIEIPQSWVDSSEMARKALAAQEKNDE